MKGWQEVAPITVTFVSSTLEGGDKDSVSSSFKRFNSNMPMRRAEQECDPKRTSEVTMKSERVGGMCHNFSYFVIPNEEPVSSAKESVPSVCHHRTSSVL